MFDFLLSEVGYKKIKGLFQIDKKKTWQSTRLTMRVKRVGFYTNDNSMKAIVSTFKGKWSK